MNGLINWIASLVSRRPFLVVAVCVLVTVVAVIGATRVKVTFRMRALYDYPGNKAVEQLDRYNEEFGDDGGFDIAVIETKDVFTTPVLRYIQEISRKLKRKPQFRRIMSLSLNTIPRGQGDDVVTGPLFERVPTDPKSLRHIKEVALSSRIAVPRLVSKDGRYAMVAAELLKPFNQLTADKLEAGNKAMREVVDSTPAPPGVRVILGGQSFSEVAGPKVMEGEQKLFLPIGLALIVLVMMLSFGTWHGVVLTFAEVILTLTWTFGFMGYAGISFNILTASTPTILMVYGLLDSVFLMAMFYKIYETAGEGRQGVRDAAQTTVQRMGWACALTSFSTAIGFLGFSAGSVPMLQSFGVVLAVGAVFAFISSIVWMPALLCLIAKPKKMRMRRSPITRLVQNVTKLGPFTRRWRWAIIIGSLAVFATAAVTFYSKAYISALTLKELPQDMDGIEGINLVADHLVGAISTGVEVTGKPGSMKEPGVFKALNEIDEWAETRKIVTSSLSPSDLIRDMHRAFNGGSPKFDKVPNDRSLISQYLTLLDPPTRADFISDDYAKTHLRVMCRDVGSYRWRHELYEPLQKKARALLPGYKLSFPGYLRAVEEGSVTAVTQMIGGFLIAFAAIATMLGIAFRSLRLALLSVVPNLLPTMAAMAMMVASGTTLRIPTVIFLCVAVGITFDNTIHLFSGVRDALARGLSQEEALRETLGEIGPPIVFTSLLIAAGLGIFTVSSFSMLFTLGLTCATTVLLGAISDLLLTTTLLGRWGGLLAPKKSPPLSPAMPGGSESPG